MAFLSDTLARVKPSPTIAVTTKAAELKAAGRDVIGLGAGEPDFDTPTHIKEAVKKAVDENYSHYTPVAGYPELRQAVCTKLKRDNNLDYKPENIITSTGAKQSLANIILSMIDEGDEVIIPTPFWVTYSELVKIARGKVVQIQTSLENSFKLTPEQLEAAITDRTRLFMFSSPCNPSGSVYSLEELQALVKVFEKYPDVYILSDEIYEYINFVGKHESIAQFESIKERVIIVNGLSKGFAMTGWRLGYIAAHVDIVKACDKIQGQFTSGASSITQKAAVTALTTDLKPTYAMTEEFARRRKRVMEIIKDIPWGWVGVWMGMGVWNWLGVQQCV